MQLNGVDSNAQAADHRSTTDRGEARDRVDALLDQIANSRRSLEQLPRQFFLGVVWITAVSSVVVILLHLARAFLVVAPEPPNVRLVIFNSTALVLCLGLAWYYRKPDRSHIKGAFVGYVLLVVQTTFAIKHNGLLPLVTFTGFILTSYLILPRRLARWVAGAVFLALATAPLQTNLNPEVWMRLLIVNAIMIGFCELVSRTITRSIDNFGITARALDALSATLVRDNQSLRDAKQRAEEASRITSELMVKVEASSTTLDAERQDLKKVVDISPICVGFASQGRLVWLNPKATELLGLREGDLAETLYANEAQKQAIRASFEAGKQVINEPIEVNAADGRRLHMLVTFLHCELRGITGALGWLVDITEQKKAQEQLTLANEAAEAANRRLQAIAEVGVDRFWETDAEHRFTNLWGSNAMHRLAPPELMLGRTRWEVSPPRDEEEQQMWAAHRDTLDRHLPFNDFEYATRQPDGSRRWVSISGRPVFDEQGRFTGYIGRVTDISWRKEKEAALLAAKQEAESANRAKSEFLATMSHEIRTPMNGILGMTALALEGELSAEQRENLEVVQQSADSLLNIINDILDLSKIEAGQMQLESVPLDLRGTVNAVLKMLSFNAHNKGLELAAEVALDVPAWIAGDPTRLRQVLINLVGNAIKFTSKGSVTVCVKREGGDALGTSLRFEVRDTGIGIAADKLEAIFQPFSQADSSTTRNYGGTGLGLAICRRLVHMMGGEIAVESTPGQGSTFHFVARFEPASAPQAAQAQDVAGARRKLNILLVDDHPINQMLATKILQRAGHQVSVAVDGLQAIAQWRSLKPDAILMDVQMPVMDGLEATRRIRAAEAEEQLPRTPIIAMTANAFAEDREACIDAGMNTYLVKPVKPEVLQRTLNETVPSRLH